MTVFIGTVLILSVLMWNIAAHSEWKTPLSWQSFLARWKEELNCKTSNLDYVWVLDSADRELEKHFYQLRRALPRLKREFRAPLWLKVGVQFDKSSEENAKYIACLQRRFPEIEVYECQDLASATWTRQEL